MRQQVNKDCCRAKNRSLKCVIILKAKFKKISNNSVNLHQILLARQLRKDAVQVLYPPRFLS